MIPENDRLLALLQICDTGFPTGGFSHSSGLEAALKVKSVRDKDSLKSFIHCCLENTGSFLLPFLKEAHQQCTDIKHLQDLDQLLEACSASHVARRASVRQGCSMLDTSMKVFKDGRLRPISEELPYKHYPIIFGVTCGLLGIDLHSAMAAFLYNTIRSVIGSAVRLDCVGPIEAQAIQFEIQKQVPGVIQRNLQRVSDDACLVYPHIDVVQNIHDTMFTKLFYT